MNTPQHSIEKIVITGGPCSGKSTGISLIADTLLDRGFVPFIVPETPTELHEMGIFDLNLPNDTLQKLIVKYQVRAEQQIEKTAQMLQQVFQGREPIILCDRGVGDGRAYIDHGLFDDILKKSGFPQGITDVFGRYRMVLHLDTAPKQFYTTDNNDARSEKTREEAMIKNARTEHAWLGAPHRRKITNDYASFNEKILAGANEILLNLGVPETYEREDTYEVGGVDIGIFAENGVNLVESTVEQDYLISDAAHLVRRIRRRGWAPGCWIYTYTLKDRSNDIEHEKIIDMGEYQRLLGEKDLRCTTVQKKRYNFVRAGHYFELDYFLTGSKKGKWALEVEKSSKDQLVTLPPFLNILGQVDWKNEEMARIV